MARPIKVKVDYFPHVTHSGKTIAILEAHWGNDGYAFWYKLLELLGDSDDFTYDCNHSADWEYLLSKAQIDESVALAILDKLAEIRAIDAELWTEKIVWCDNFVSNLEPVFEKRKRQAPQKPQVASFCAGNSAVAAELPTQTGKEKESKAEQSKAEQREGKQTGQEERESACPSMLREGVVSQADTVYLKPVERQRLSQEFGEAGAERLIELLDSYKTNHPQKCAEYRDDYKVIQAWVISRYREELSPPGRSKRAGPAGSKTATFNDKLAALAKGAEE